MSTEKNKNKKYYHGTAVMVATQCNVSPKYVRDVLRGVHDDRKTDTVKTIKKAAEAYKK